MIRLCLAEDQTIVRRGLRALIDLVEDIEVVAEAGDGLEALDVVERVHPDVLLLDVRMPKLDGLGVLKQLQARGAAPPTIILTTFDDDAVMFEGIRSGAKGYLLKDISLQRLTSAIRLVASGGTMIQPVLTERILRELGKPGTPASTPGNRLSERELQVLRLMTAGCSNREIASAFKLAEGTVKNHISSVLAKLGVHDRTRAVLKAIELGYVK